MANEDREIRFIDPMYNEKFRIPDSGTIRIDYPDRSFTARCEYIDDYHTSINNRVFHICEFAELMERNGGVVQPEKVFIKEEQDRLTEAMEVAGMHFDELDSSPDSLRFTSELGIVTYFESWEEVENWIEGIVFDDPEVEQEVDEILHPEQYEEQKLRDMEPLEHGGEKEITVLVVAPGMEPEVRKIGTDLASLQEKVDGMIEVIYPFEDNVGLIMNEEGKLEGLPLNRGLYDREGNLYDIIAGTFVVTGLWDDGFASLTPEQISKYTEMYQQPQMFVRTNGSITAVPMEKKKEIGTFELYQLKDSPELISMRFAPYKRLAKHGRPVSRSNYDKVYSGKLFAGETLDSIYERFNLHHPADFRGHSLSVSDVIVLHTNNQDQAFYVDSFGFKQVSEFFADNPLKKVEELIEDDYGMIDGILNNGDRRKDEEEKKTSVMERLQEKKKEAKAAEETRPKMPKKEKDRNVELS